MIRAELIAPENLPIIQKGDNIAKEILGAFAKESVDIQEGDVLVIAHKIVSKAEGAIADLTTIKPSQKALELSQKTGRDPRLCQVYLNESAEVLEVRGRMVVTRQRLGFVCTNAGVDRSNIDGDVAVLLPKDPDESARRIRQEILEMTGKKVAVIISDSFGKPDRYGAIGVAIGIAGIAPLEMKAQRDIFGKEMNAEIALIDELAGAASILMGEADQKLPVVLIKGVHFTVDETANIKKILEN